MATSAQAKAFIALVAPIIQKVAKERGYKVCSPIIAQACCESAYGTSSLWTKYFNAFGMKCGSSWKGKSVNMKTKEEYTVGVLTTIKDNFRAYDNPTQGINGYFDFISTKRYSNLKNAKTPTEYLQLIKADGYATSSTYVNTNMTIVNRYDLTKYDNFDYVTPVATEIAKPTYKVGVTYTTTANLNVRVTPNGEKKLITELTKNAKANSYDDGNGCAILRKGTRVTCQGVSEVNKQTWLKIPSGYICAIDNGKVYIK